MLIATLILAAAVLILAAGLIGEQRLHSRHVIDLTQQHNEQLAQMANKITRPETPIGAPRPVPKVQQRRTVENARDYARVGTVAHARDVPEATSPSANPGSPFGI